MLSAAMTIVSQVKFRFGLLLYKRYKAIPLVSFQLQPLKGFDILGDTTVDIYHIAHCSNLALLFHLSHVVPTAQRHT